MRDSDLFGKNFLNGVQEEIVEALQEEEGLEGVMIAEHQFEEAATPYVRVLVERVRGWGDVQFLGAKLGVICEVRMHQQDPFVISELVEAVVVSVGSWDEMIEGVVKVQLEEIRIEQEADTMEYRALVPVDIWVKE